jgi:hypothetical protein
MAGLVPAIHGFDPAACQFVDARHKAGHDEFILSNDGYFGSAPEPDFELRVHL